MQTEQSRAILAAVEARDRAVNNLRNAVAMSVDDPRAKQLLEEAGDSYAAAVERLEGIDRSVVGPRADLFAVTSIAPPGDPASAPETPPAAPSAPQGGQAPPPAVTPPEGAPVPPADPGVAPGAEAPAAPIPPAS